MTAFAYVPFVGEQTNQSICHDSRTQQHITQGISEVKLMSIDEILQLQEHAYSSVPERRNTRHVLESYVSASIERAVQDRKPQLSYEYRDDNLKLIGFVLSLVGDAESTKTKRFVKPLKKYTGHTKCIYVSEWCTSSQVGSGGLLLKRFFSDYARFYLCGNTLPTIVGDHRIATSFGLIKQGLGIIDKIINSRKFCTHETGLIYMQRIVGPKHVMGDEQRSVFLVPRLYTT